MRLGIAAVLVGLAGTAHSQSLPTDIPTIDVVLLKVSGKVSTPKGEVLAGVGITLRYDLDRDGAYSAIETATTTTDAAGEYKIEYTPDLTKADAAFIQFATDLQEKVKADGPTAIFKDAALSYGIEFDKEGYTTVLKRFSILNLENVVSVYMDPLQKIACGKSACLTPDGGLEVLGLTPELGIRAGYARSFSPGLEPGRFPGGFRAQDDSLLVSTGFMEVDFRDASGAKVTTIPSPVTLRYRLEKDSWSTVVDTTPGNDRINVGIYTYSREIFDWVREADGHLESGEGEVVPESDLAAVVAGTYAKELYTVISTTHFTYWNTDRPLDTQTCVKGRIVDADGLPVPGALVEGRGLSYEGHVEGVTTGPDGMFAVAVQRSSEVAIFVQIAGKLGVGPEFTSSDENLKIVKGGSLQCLPAECNCPKIDDVFIPDVTDVKVCTYRVITSHTGEVGRQSRDQEASYNPGESASGFKVYVSGGKAPELALSQVLGQCADANCYEGTTDEEGIATVKVPVLKSATGNVFVKADMKRTQTGLGLEEYYNGQVPAPLCEASGDVVDVVMPVTGNVLRPLDEHMDALLDDDLAKATGCGCFNSGDKKQKSGPSVVEAFLIFLPVALPLWRRRKPKGKA